ncbi:unnamed protein product [Arctogadus glacialis]
MLTAPETLCNCPALKSSQRAAGRRRHEGWPVTPQRPGVDKKHQLISAWPPPPASLDGAAAETDGDRRRQTGNSSSALLSDGGISVTETEIGWSQRPCVPGPRVGVVEVCRRG